MSKKPEPKVSDIDTFLADVDSKSIKNMLEAGVILPQLKPELNVVYTAKVLSLPKSFTSDYGLTHCFDVSYDGMDHSLIAPKSFKVQLVAEMHRKKYVTENKETKEILPDFKQLIGKTIKVKKVIGDTKEFKNAKLYTVQIVD